MFLLRNGGYPKGRLYWRLESLEKDARKLKVPFKDYSGIVESPSTIFHLKWRILKEDCKRTTRT